MKPPAEFESDPRVQAEFANAAGDDIPDPASYSEWFAGASPKARMAAVGVRRYQVVGKRLGALGQEPSWNDFIRPDGALVPLRSLQKESTAQHAARREKVDAMLLAHRQSTINVSRYGFDREATGKG